MKIKQHFNFILSAILSKSVFISMAVRYGEFVFPVHSVSHGPPKLTSPRALKLNHRKKKYDFFLFHRRRRRHSLLLLSTTTTLLLLFVFNFFSIRICFFFLDMCVLLVRACFFFLSSSVSIDAFSVSCLASRFSCRHLFEHCFLSVEFT